MEAASGTTTHDEHDAIARGYRRPLFSGIVPRVAIAVANLVAIVIAVRMRKGGKQPAVPVPRARAA